MRANAKRTKADSGEKEKSKVTRVLASEAKRMQSRTDWKRVRALRDEDLERAVADDEDAAPIFTDEMLSQVRAARRGAKDLVSLRLDHSIVMFFKRRGPKYTTQINDVLRAFVDAHANERKRSKR